MSLYEELVAHLRANGWPVVPRPSEGSVRWRFEGVHDTWDCLALAREHDRRILVYSVRAAAPTAIEQLMEFTTRANWLLPAGTFELDLDSGEVRLRTALAVGAELDEIALSRALLDNVITFDRYLPGLDAVAEGQTASAAAAEIEMGADT